MFTEIKEQRHWDIRSSERLDILRRYTNYGLEHWGSDTQGVENTRKFLLEWLSFLHRYHHHNGGSTWLHTSSNCTICRYIPVGLLERPPQKINQRPPYYWGRDDLETLMASNNCQDWIKIRQVKVLRSRLLLYCTTTPFTAVRCFWDLHQETSASFQNTKQILTVSKNNSTCLLNTLNY